MADSQSTHSGFSGQLYVVGTPIGNLEDMTFRAVRVLQEVDLIAAEDTRHTAKLLQHFQIVTPQISYHEHNHHQRTPELIGRLQAGQSLALVSDAGMPAISDPGYELVKGCIEAGIAITPIPGPTAAISALCISGLPTNRFVFEGFLPPKGRERRERLQSICHETRTIILYEAPHRLITTLEDLIQALGGDHQITITRELTKRHEEHWHGTLDDGLAYYNHHTPRGEFTLVIAGVIPITPLLSEGDLRVELQQLLKQGMSRSQASRELAQRTSLSRRDLYQLTLNIESE